MSTSYRVAEDAVHRRILLAEDLADPQFRMFMQGFIDSTRREKDIAGEPLFSPTETADSVCDHMLHVLRTCETFYVATEMMELATTAAPLMPDEALLPYDLPCTRGFMWFQVPYRQLDLRRKLIGTDAIMWDARNQKVKVWHFTAKGNPYDWVNQKAIADGYFDVMPALSLNHVFSLEFGKELPRGYSWDDPLPFDANVTIDQITNPDGTKAYRLMTDHYLDSTKPPEVIRSPLSAFIVCLWRLCQQTIIDKVPEEPSRSLKRRLGKVNLPESPITVIRLRKRERKSEHAEAGVEWSHQWMVREHWRRQPYKEDGETVYRWILIHPFIKGPPDKPLLIREKVNFLVR